MPAVGCAADNGVMLFWPTIHTQRDALPLPSLYNDGSAFLQAYDADEQFEGIDRLVHGRQTHVLDRLGYQTSSSSGSGDRMPTDGEVRCMLAESPE